MSRLLETILAETHYEAWVEGQERGAQRVRNIQRLAALAADFDQLQRQGLYRFVRTVEAQQDAEIPLAPAALAAENAVHLLSVHKSKGLEFPVVIVADLGKKLNFRDAQEMVFWDRDCGLAPRVRLSAGGAPYPTLGHWLVSRKSRERTVAEEMRLFYVAATRAERTADSDWQHHIEKAAPGLPGQFARPE